MPVENVNNLASGAAGKPAVPKWRPKSLRRRTPRRQGSLRASENGGTTKAMAVVLQCPAHMRLR